MEYRQHASVGVLRNDTYYKHVCAMTDEKLRDKSEIAEELAVRDMRIKQLEAQLATITQERDDLLQARAICPECAKKIDEAAGIDLVGLNRQLAASQACAAQLREALEEVKRHGIEAPHPWAKELAQEALALPADDTALREWGAKLLREMAHKQALDGRGGDLLRKATELRANKPF